MADTTTTVYGLTKPENLAAAGAGLWGPKLNGDLDTLDAELSKPRIIQNAPPIGATTTFDLSLARVFTLTVSQITTVAFTNVPTSTFAVRVLLVLTNANAFAVTFPASVYWLEGPPTFRTSGIDVVELITRDGGTTFYARLLGGYVPVVRNMTAVGTVAATIETTLHTLAVPAGVMGVTGAIRISGLYAITGAGSTKDFRVKLGGTTLGSFQFSAGQTINGSFVLLVVNQGSASVQLASGWYTLSTAAMSGFGHTTGAVNTAVAQNVTITGQTPNAADEVTASATMVEIIPAL